MTKEIREYLYEKILSNRNYLDKRDLFTFINRGNRNIHSEIFDKFYSEISYYLPKVKNACIYPDDNLILDIRIDLEDLEDIVYKFIRIKNQNEIIPFKDDAELTFENILIFINKCIIDKL